MVLTGPLWRKASRSQSQSNCVEIALTEAGAAVRDSKNPTGPALHVPSWAASLSAIKDGRLD